MIRCIAPWLGALLLLASGDPAVGAAVPPSRAWTPRTSVEMRYFPRDLAVPQHWPGTTDSGGGVLFAPDRRHFLFVEYRGDLGADAGVARLSIHESDAVRRALQSGRGAVAPLRSIERQSRSSSLPAMAGIRWDDAGQGIIFRGVEDGTVSLFHFDLGTGHLTTIASWPSNRAYAAVYGSRDGTSVAFLTEPIETPPANHYPAAWLERDRDEAPLLAGNWLRRGSGRRLARAMAGCAGQAAPTPQIAATRISIVAISPTECRAIVIGADSGEARWAYHLLDITSGRATRLAASTSGRNSVIWSPDGRWALLADTQGAPAGMSLVEASSGRLVPIPGTTPIGDPRHAGIEWRSARELSLPRGAHVTGASMLLLRDGAWRLADAPPRATRAGAAPANGEGQLSVAIEQDFNTPARVVARLGGRRLVLSEPDPALAGVERAAWQEIGWIGTDGRPRRAALMLPPRGSAGPPPLVVNPYWYERLGGSHRRLFLPDGQHAGAESAAQALAARGIATLWMDGWDDAEVIGDRAEGERFVGLLDGAIGELARRRLIDLHRIGVAGFSRGGYLALYAATHPGRFPVLAYVGIDNIVGSSASTLYEEALRQPNQGLGNFATDRARWDAHDTLMNVVRVKGPFLFTIHADGGGEDPARAALYAVHYRTLFGAFMQARRPFDLLTFPEGTHNLTRPRERLALMNAIVDWMAFWLLDETPQDVERARHWSLMRAHWRRQQEWEAIGNVVGSTPPPDFRPGLAAPSPRTG